MRANSGGCDDCCGSLGVGVASVVFTSEGVGLEGVRVSEVAAVVELNTEGEDCWGDELVLVGELSLAPVLITEVVESKVDVSEMIVVVAERVDTVVVEIDNERLENVLLLVSSGVCEDEASVSLSDCRMETVAAWRACRLRLPKVGLDSIRD